MRIRLASVNSWRARRGAAIRHGDEELAAEADAELRAIRLAQKIKTELAAGPLPQGAAWELCAMLTNGGEA